MSAEAIPRRISEGCHVVGAFAVGSSTIVAPAAAADAPMTPAAAPTRAGGIAASELDGSSFVQALVNAPRPDGEPTPNDYRSRKQR